MALILLLFSCSAATADDRSLCNSHSSPPDQAIAACNRIIGGGRLRGTDLASRYVDRGYQWSRKGDSDRALSDYNQAIVVHPSLSVAYLDRGVIWFGKRDYERALTDYNKAITLATSRDPNLSFVYNNRGNVWRAKGELNRALADYDKAISINPKYALAYRNRASLWAAKGDYTRAIADFDLALRNSPKDIAAYIGRANARAQKDDHDGALTDYDRAIGIDPNNAFTYAARASLWQAMESLDRGKNDVEGARAAAERALKDFDEAIRLNPRNDGFYNGRGNLLLARGDFDRALADYSTAVSLNPNNATAYHNRCITRRRKADIDGAIADCTAAIRLDPNYTSAFTNRGQAFETKGDRESARADYRSALALPAKYESGKSALDIARARLAVLAPGGSNAPITAAPAPPPAAGRLALVIGHGAYPGASLDNPPNDARAMGQALRNIGFEVIEGIDLDYSGMTRILRDFLLRASSARIAVMFYAGHGVQIKGKNYLAPTDARVLTEATVELQFINVDKILDGLSDQARTNIIILDACRNNPFENAGTRAAGGGSGLAAPSSSDAGTLIAFATQPNSVADDGEGQHSPYTAALLKYITDPKLEVVAMLREVGKAVRIATNQKQVPFMNLPPIGDVYLARDTKRAAAN